MYSFCQQRAVARTDWVTKKMGSSKTTHILMTALILHEDGKMLKEPNALQGGEGYMYVPSLKGCTYRAPQNHFP